MKTQVAIVGAGPSGTLLAAILQQHGIESIVIERQTRDYILDRIRAGVLESTSAEILRNAGLGDRLDREGFVHDNVQLAWRGEDVMTIEFSRLAGKQMIAYGQTLIQEDLYDAVDDRGLNVIFECRDVAVHDPDTDSPYLTFSRDGTQQRVDCDIVAGCDGQHGVCQTVIPDRVKTTVERGYPFGWLGILSETKPLPELVYANHKNGFALCSQRNPKLSRYYVQCSLDETVDDWSDDRFWSELFDRLPNSIADEIESGPSIEKSIAPLRSRVISPMQFGRLFLAGDAGHIVPPTGAKGLNLAISDVHYLSEAIAAFYRGDEAKLDAYSEVALRRVWSSVRFSWWMTTLLHHFPGQSDFEQRMREEDLRYLNDSEAARTAMAEQYVGLPL